jgi:predicted ArsR family transcriptional regulator
VVRTIVAAGGAVLKANGTLNISALARLLGLSDSAARRQVDLLRHELVVAKYRF